MTTTAPRAAGDPFPYIVLAAAAPVLGSDGALYVASHVLGDHPTPGSPSALVRALQAGYRPTTPVAVLAASCLLVLFSAVVALALWWTGRHKRGTSTPARWAKPAELRPLQVPAEASERPNRLPLGYVGRRLLAAKVNHSVLVVGPVGSGKTESFAIGATLDHGGPAIVTSVKRDLIDATIDARSQLGPVYVYDPDCSTGRICSTWSPLPQCATWDGARLMARWLVDAARPTSGGSEVGEFFGTLARYLLAPLLHAAALDKRPVTDVLRWLKSQDYEEARIILNETVADAQAGVVDTPADDARAALVDVGAFDDWAKETRTGVTATALVLLSPYDDPGVAASAATCEIDAGELLDKSGTLYLCAPLNAQGRFRPLFEALISQVIRAAQARAQAGRPVDPGLLLMLDEAGNVAPLRALPDLLSTGRGQAIILATVWQSLGQLRERYGQNGAETVLTNSAQLALAGISDLATLDHFSRLCGDTEVDRTSTTHQAQGGRSTSTGPQTRRLAPADQLRLLKVGQGLLLASGVPPVMLRLRRVVS
jgi:type IV secretion system protein VirD4